MTEFLTPVIKSFVDVLYPLRKGMQSAEDFELLLVKYGWDARINDAQMVPIRAAFAIEQLVESIVEKLDTFVNGVNVDRANAALELITEVKNCITLITKLSSSSAGLPAPLNQESFWSEISTDIFSDLLAHYFEKRQPVIYAIFHISGIISYEKKNPVAANRIKYTQTKLDFGKLGEFFSSPFDLFKNTYKWNVSGQDFDHQKLLRTLERVFLSFRIPAMVNLPRESAANKFLDISQIGLQQIRELEIPIIDGVSPSDNSYWKIGVVMLPIPDPIKGNGKVKGIALIPLLQGQLSTSIYFSKDIYLKFTGAFDADNAISIQIFGNKASLESSLADVEIKASFELIGDPIEPWVLLGSADSSRLELGGFKVMFAVQGKISDPEIIFSIGTGGAETNKNPRLSFVFDPSGGDSFITTILGEDGFKVDFQSNLTWSSKTGLAFEGQSGFEVELPIHLALGPIEITTIYLAMKGGNIGGKPSAKADIGIGLKGELGPLSFVVENIGVSLLLKPLSGSSEKGLFGNHDLAFGFKPPNGLGLSINAGAVIGGGYLFFDFEKEEYAGVLELTIAGFISAKAIGLITTKMPDGSKGFSMLIIITAEFMPAFQLGYGFTLIGVGGLLGLNRTVLLDPLRDAVRTGAVTSIMFPQNVIANAPRIISDLKAIFPPYEGKFLIGPMAKLGWGTPTLISLSLGLIIEIPGNFAILGVLKIALPEERIPLVQIQVLFVGTIDFDKKMLTFDASLYESFILTMTIEGDMAVRLKWGDNPDFLLSVGGFHPSYTPPPLALPTMRRLAINILNTDIARIRVECYSAITSNTVQFGARADIMFDLSVCSITGFISFDALFQFSPFYFIIEVAAGFSLKAGGIDLLSVRVRMSLEGPTPWRARGTGSVSILFFEISADFDVTWGEEKNTSLPDIAILQTFIDEVKKKELWSTVLSTGKNLLVSLRKFDNVAEANVLVMHPAGSLVVQQKLLPLKVNFTKIGNQKTSDVQKIEITAATSSDKALTITDVDENFARAQYQNLSDAEKLSKPSFEKMAGGVSLTLGANTIKNGKLVRKKVKYEITIIDKEPVKRLKGLFFGQMEILFANFLKGNSVSKSVLSKNYFEKLQPFTEKMNVLEEGYILAFQSNNKAYSTNATFRSEMMAQTFMQEQIARDPSLQKEVHIISNFELQTS